MSQELIESKNKAIEISKIGGALSWLDSHHIDIDKTSLLNNFKLKGDINKVFDEVQLNNSKNKDLVLCYSMFGHWSYIKLLYFSIVSNILFTDINKFTIKIFVQSCWYNKVVDLFGFYLGVENIIEVPEGLCFKHHIVNHREVIDYDVVVINDTDSFVVSNKFQSSRYTDLYNYHIENQETGLFAFRGDVAINSYNSAYKYLNPKELDYNTYRDIFNLEKDFLDNNNWYHTCHFSYHKNVFNKTQLDKFKWSDFLLDVSFTGVGCDETIFLTALQRLRKNKDIINHYIPHYQVVDSLEKLESYELVHPLIGDWCTNKKNNSFFQFIINKSTEFLNE